MANIRVELASTSALGAGAPALRARLASLEGALGGNAALRVRLTTAEGAIGGVPNIRTRLNAVESTVGNYPHLRTRAVVVECLQEVLEPFMSSLVFPKLIGLAYEVHKSPMFSTKLAEHTGGGETATSFFQNPKWEFKLTYDYLPDTPKSVGDTDLHQIMGLFLQMRGRGDTFLFQDPDDYSAVAATQLTFDGVTTQFKLVRTLGGFIEPIGQLDQSVVTLQLWIDVDETFNVPSVGPYTHTVAHAAKYVKTDSVTINGVAATVGTGAGQYTVAAGVYTFNAADAGKAVDVRYQWLAASGTDYSITMPNVIIMTTAPPNGAVATATFNYYFVCRFLQDTSDYSKFMNQLWNLQELGFRSIPQ